MNRGRRPSQKGKGYTYTYISPGASWSFQGRVMWTFPFWGFHATFPNCITYQSKLYWKEMVSHVEFAQTGLWCRWMLVANRWTLNQHTRYSNDLFWNCLANICQHGVSPWTKQHQLLFENFLGPWNFSYEFLVSRISPNTNKKTQTGGQNALSRYCEDIEFSCQQLLQHSQMLGATCFAVCWRFGTWFGFTWWWFLFFHLKTWEDGSIWTCGSTTS